MRSETRLIIVFAFAALGVAACASSTNDKPNDQESIATLEAKIPQAQPREQCFLYVELIHQMSEFSLKQYAAGDVDKANDLLKQIQQLSHKVHVSMAQNDKRLKDAEILLRRTAFRLSELLHNSSSDERPLVQQTLTQVNQVQNEAMLEVFHK